MGKKQTNISKNKDGITGHESKRLMSCQEKLHSSVKYIGKCLIAVKSTIKRSDEYMFLQQRKIILSEKPSLLRKITLYVLWFAPWEIVGGRRFARILEEFLNDIFTKLSVFLTDSRENYIVKSCSVTPLYRGLWKPVSNAGQQNFLESYTAPVKAASKFHR